MWIIRVWLLTWSLQGRVLLIFDHFRVSPLWRIHCDANHVHLSTAPRSVRIHWAHHQLTTFARSLPRLPSEVDVLIVRKDYQQGQMNSTIITLSLIQSLSCTHMTYQKLISNYTRHWHPHSLRLPKWRLRHPSYCNFWRGGLMPGSHLIMCTPSCQWILYNNTPFKMQQFLNWIHSSQAVNEYCTMQPQNPQVLWTCPVYRSPHCSVNSCNQLPVAHQTLVAV